MEKKQTLDKDVQAAINKLVSDEWFAGNIYRYFVISVNEEDRSKISGEMLDISSDELNDHLKSIIDFALANGFSVPASYNEMKKFADKEDVKLFENCKKNENALFYIDKGIDAENRAIKTYQKYVDDYDFSHSFQDFKLIIQNNYYDEIDHLDKLNFMKKSIESIQKFY